MIKLWRKILLPLCEAVDARTFLEIGAEYGKSTHALMQYVKRVEGHLHCIDPAPAFEAEAFAKEHSSCLSFYRALSLDVIGELPRHDVVMVDGDHNWFTVYNELRALESLHGENPLHQPLIFLHDIGWPYGRRDLYYAPETIPAEYRHEYARAGMLPNKSELVENGGLNPELCNAGHEGGPQNGVLTAVEDFLAQSTQEWEFQQLPVYYGLGILVTRQRVDSNARLKDTLASIGMTDRVRGIMAHGEHLRCVDGIMMQEISRRLSAAEEALQGLQAELEAMKAQSGES
jgi:hypothetical protein